MLSCLTTLADFSYDSVHFWPIINPFCHLGLGSCSYTKTCKPLTVVYLELALAIWYASPHAGAVPVPFLIVIFLTRLLCK